MITSHFDVTPFRFTILRAPLCDCRPLGGLAACREGSRAIFLGFPLDVGDTTGANFFFEIHSQLKRKLGP